MQQRRITDAGGASQPKMTADPSNKTALKK
jgi:hypothetical protein